MNSNDDRLHSIHTRVRKREPRTRTRCSHEPRQSYQWWIPVDLTTTRRYLTREFAFMFVLKPETRKPRYLTNS